MILATLSTPPTTRPHVISRAEGVILLFLGAVALVVSGIGPADRTTWWLEIFPILLAVPVLLVTRNRFPLTRGKWLFATVTAFCLAISACYEFVEWWAAVFGGSAADAFLGTQGDVWDTQWDMFMAFIGAIAALVLLRRVHDRQLERLEPRRDR